MDTNDMTFQGRRIGVIGAGAFGTAIADVLSETHQVCLGVRENARAYQGTPLLEYMQEHRENPVYLKGFPLSPALMIQPDVEAAADKDILIFILPVKYLRQAVKDLNERLESELGARIHPETIIVSGMKGMEVDSSKRPSEVLMEEFDFMDKKQFAVLAGATFARELMARHNLSASVAAYDKKLAVKLARILTICNKLNIHPSMDVMGTEILGALKNIVAIGSGYLAASEKSLGSRYTFIGKAFIETQKLVHFLGGDRSTCFQEAGFPDFMMSANADMSRNFSAGMRLAETGKIEYEGEAGVAEGVNTSLALYRLFEKKGLGFARKHFRIFFEMYHVIHNGKDPEKSFQNILSHYNADPEFSKFRETVELLRYRFGRS